MVGAFCVDLGKKKGPMGLIRFKQALGPFKRKITIIIIEMQMKTKIRIKYDKQ